MAEFRHEYKYICTRQQIETIRNNIMGIMQPDKNAGRSGEYVVRSLYFDDYSDSCLYDNINGTDPREKFRIRIYNADLSYIRLERKCKEHGKTRKASCRIDERLCMEMIQGRSLRMDAVDADVYRKFCLWQNTKFLKPAVITEYDRIPYVYNDGNVRITFDQNIRAGALVKDFTKQRIATHPVMPLNQHLLEVKFDEFIPDFIYSLVQTEKLRQTTFSKYYMCRRNHFGGNRL